MKQEVAERYKTLSHDYILKTYHNVLLPILSSEEFMLSSNINKYSIVMLFEAPIIEMDNVFVRKIFRNCIFASFIFVPYPYPHTLCGIYMLEKIMV